MKKKHRRAEKIEEGLMVKDCFNQYWTLGKTLGQGGFGIIYLG